MWHVVVPLKGSPDAKSRLAVSQTARLELVRAMAADTVAAVAASADIRTITILARTSDLGLPPAVTSAADVVVQPRRVSSLNDVLEWFSCELGGTSDPLAVVVADLPALRPRSMEQVLTAALTHPHAMVQDADERGTTVLTARDPALLHPQFGLQSADRHRRAGAVVLSADPHVRRDVDTIEDLREGRRLGLGPHTAAILADDEQGTYG